MTGSRLTIAVEDEGLYTVDELLCVRQLRGSRCEVHAKDIIT